MYAQLSRGSILGHARANAGVCSIRSPYSGVQECTSSKVLYLGLELGYNNLLKREQ